jgi:O-antigen/teichoic acid export membrane protein
MPGTSQRSGPLARVRRAIGGLLADRLVRNVGWYGLAEFANRFTRIVTTIVLARWLLPADFGIAATAITTFEIVRVLAQYGIGQAVIRAPDAELAGLCATAYRASWLVCLAAFAVQLCVGAIIAQVSGRPETFGMIACLALVYLSLPFGQIQAHLIARSNRLHVLAGIAVVQVAADNLLTAALAVAGIGAWAVVLPKLITAPIWVIGMRRAQSWQMDPGAGSAPIGGLLRFAAPVIGSELLVAVRYNLDKVLVGAMLGLEALGIYYFVFNAGLGFSLSLTASLATSVYPHLAEVAARREALIARYDGLVRRAVMPVAGIIALQAMLAIFYVPVVFGARWDHVAPLVAVLCASAVAKPLFDSACQLLRAAGAPRIEFYGSAVLTAVSLAALAAGLIAGLTTGIVAMSAAVAAVQIVFALAVRRHFGRSLPAAMPEPSAPSTPTMTPAGAHP